MNKDIDIIFSSFFNDNNNQPYSNKRTIFLVGYFPKKTTSKA